VQGISVVLPFQLEVTGHRGWLSGIDSVELPHSVRIVRGFVRRSPLELTDAVSEIGGYRGFKTKNRIEFSLFHATTGSYELSGSDLILEGRGNQ
jgi:hypothetical protein